VGQIFGLILFWAAACSSATAQTVLTYREPLQQLAAELVVLAGDVRRLRYEKAGPLETLGLEKRLLGGVASLPLTLRRVGADGAIATELRQNMVRRDWSSLADQLDALKHRYPFDARPFLDAESTSAMRKLGEKIHHEICGGCHDNPMTQDTLLPAKTLVSQLKSMPREEFAARLWLGVRGDKFTAYSNPFSHNELAALIAWYEG